MAFPSSRRDGVLLMIAAGLCWSTGGIFVRNVASTDGWEIVFWRSLFMVAFLFSDDGAYVNGQTILVDGGAHLT